MKPIALATIFGFCLLATVLHAAPSIELGTASWDYGTMKQGEKRSHTFTFRNTGDAELVVERVRSSCGCTVARIGRKGEAPARAAQGQAALRLAPQAEGEIEVTFDSKGRRGPFTKSVTLFTNVPGKERVRLSVSGEIEVPPQPEIALSPARLQLGCIAPGAAVKRALSVKNPGKKPLRIDAVGLSRGSLELGDVKTEKGETAAFPLEVPPGGELPLEILFRTAEGAAPGILRSSLKIETNVPRRKTTHATLLGYIVGESPFLRVSPPARKAVEGESVPLPIRNDGTLPVEVKVRRTPKGLSLASPKALSIGPGEEESLRLTVEKADTADGTVELLLKIPLSLEEGQGSGGKRQDPR